MAGKWGIDIGDAWPGWAEQARIDRSVTNPTNVSDNAVTNQTLLVDQRGRPLLVKTPRRVGFDPRRSA